MKRYLLSLVFGVVLMLLSGQAFSQVTLSNSGVTKFYEDGTRITYFEMAGFPNTEEMRVYVKKSVLENPDFKRIIIYSNGKKFMYESLQSIEPAMVVDAVNDALAEYKSEFGEFPIEKASEARKVNATPDVRDNTSAKHKIAEEEVEGAPVVVPNVRVVERTEIRQKREDVNYKSTK